jgi:hypothetical protein
MIEIDKKDYLELKKVIRDIDKILKENDIDELLERVNDLIIFYLGEEYELTDVSRKYQNIYDRLYGENLA